MQWRVWIPIDHEGVCHLADTLGILIMSSSSSSSREPEHDYKTSNHDHDKEWHWRHSILQNSAPVEYSVSKIALLSLFSKGVTTLGIISDLLVLTGFTVTESAITSLCGRPSWWSNINATDGTPVIAPRTLVMMSCRTGWSLWMQRAAQVARV